MGFFDKLKESLNKTKDSFNDKINNVFSTFRKVDEELLEELEEILIMSDLGYETSIKIIDNLRNRVKKEKLEEAEQVKIVLREEMQKILEEHDSSLKLETKPSIILVVGVNGVGKTTSIGKIANRLRQEGKSVLVVAADTFRAAAVEQLEIWEKNIDVIICDTAGRLHNKKYLMDELAKINRIVDKEMPEACKETLLVIDATTGQNAIQQVKAFRETVDITGIVLTKLDGTAKGGVVIGIVAENNIPVKFIGIGEQMEDMQVFDAKKFTEAIV